MQGVVVVRRVAVPGGPYGAAAQLGRQVLLRPALGEPGPVLGFAAAPPGVAGLRRAARPPSGPGWSGAPARPSAEGGDAAPAPGSAAYGDPAAAPWCAEDRDAVPVAWSAGYRPG